MSTPDIARENFNVACRQMFNHVKYDSIQQPVRSAIFRKPGQDILVISAKYYMPLYTIVAGPDHYGDHCSQHFTGPNAKFYLRTNSERLLYVADFKPETSFVMPRYTADPFQCCIGGYPNEWPLFTLKGESIGRSK